MKRLLTALALAGAAGLLLWGWTARTEASAHIPPGTQPVDLAPLLRGAQPAPQTEALLFQQTGLGPTAVSYTHLQIPGIHSPADWARIPTFRRSDPVFTQQIDLARQVVERAGKKAYVFQTIFTPYVSAGCSVSLSLIHI